MTLALLPIAGAQAAMATDSTTSTPKRDDATPLETAPASDAAAETPTTTLPPTTTTTTLPAPTIVAPVAPVTDATPVAPPAMDDDGVDAAIENAAPHNGDGNVDGILDSEQANVASLPAAVDIDTNGSLDDYVTIVAPDGTSLEHVVALTVPSDPAPPADAVFHYGLFDYEVKVARAGDPADVTFILPSGPATSGVFMLQDEVWTEVTQHSDIDENEHEVTLGLEDGGIGDADHAADGVIDDPVGIAGQANTVTVTNATSPAGLPGSFTMTLQRCSSTTGPSCNTPTPNETPQFNLAHGESGTWGSLEIGRNYRLLETLPANWNTSSIACSPNVIVSTGDNTVTVRLTAASNHTTCTVTNTPQTSTITISMTVPNTDLTDFPFTATGPMTSNFALDDDGNNTNNPPAQLPSSITFTGMRGQAYTFAEQLPAGWGLDGAVSCSSVTESQITNGVSFTLGASNVSCVFDNVMPVGTITVHKGGTRANPAGTDTGLNYATGLQNAVFEYSPNGSAPWTQLCTTDASGDCTSATVAPGTYTVREKSAPVGWSTVGQLTYGGDGSGGGNQSHAYVGTVTVGTSGTFTPSVQYSNDPGDQNTPHRFVNVKDDKPLPAAQCGIKIAMILDTSGSIGTAPSSPTIYKNAANSFVDALAGTPTTLTRIVKFSSGATIQSPGSFPINLQTNAADANTQINNIYNAGASGSTNWDAALKLMSGSGADIVVMVTDGNPTTWDGSPNGGGSDIVLTDLEAGIASANSLKSESTILAVGVGNAPAVTAANLAAISGSGFFFTASLSEIQQQLKDLANQLCGSRLHVRKLVNNVPTDNWKFSSTATGANVSYPKGQLTGLGGNAAGEMQVNLDSVPANGATGVSVLEDLAGKTGFSVQGTKCQLGSYPDQASAIANGTTNPRSVGTVQRNLDWYCTFVNQFSSAPSTTVTQIHNGNDHTTLVTAVPLGSTVHDQATVAGSGFGTPTGSVTFTWFTSANNCTGNSLPAGTVNLANGVADPSTAFGPLAAGNYSFLAHYNGDAHYSASDATCELLAVSKAATSTVTVIHDGNDHNTAVTSVPLGSTVHDSATVTGSGFGTPTGTVTFTWYSAADDCSGNSVPAGTIALANGVAHPSTAFGPLPAGARSFRATYNGDANYAVSTGACEPLAIVAANTSSVTQIHNGTDHDTAVTSVPLGSTVHDSATVTGTAFGVPTGTVTFTWYPAANDCSGNSVPAGTIALANGVAHPSTAFGPLPAGTSSFLAHYNGSANYNASDAACEPLTILKATSDSVTAIHNGTDHTAVTSVPLGSTVHDQATVTGTAFGTPTGTVSFRWFTNNICDGDGVTAGTVALNGGVAHPSDSEGPLAVGAYSFRATYSGDANYDASTAACEPLSVTTANTSAVTAIHIGNDHDASVTTAPLGSTVHDQATVTGTRFGTPTGTVTFTWFTSAGDCTGASLPAGTVSLEDGVADPSNAFGPLPAGSYSYLAAYNGDANYNASTAACEPLTIGKANTSAVTAIHHGNSHTTGVTTVPLGSTVHDQATVTGTRFGTPTGTVTFTWFTSAGDCTGASLPAGTVSLEDGVADPSTSFGPLAAGSYSFQATYNGDANYDASTAVCEPLTVNMAASSTLTEIHRGDNHTTGVTSVPLGSTVHDSATVTGTAFGDPTGDVTFTWFTNGDCSGTGVSAGTIGLVGGVAHPSTAFGPLAAGADSFRATYAGDANYAPSTGACEPLDVHTADTATCHRDPPGRRPRHGRDERAARFDGARLGDRHRHRFRRPDRRRELPLVPEHRLLGRRHRRRHHKSRRRRGRSLDRIRAIGCREVFVPGDLRRRRGLQRVDRRLRVADGRPGRHLDDHHDPRRRS